MVIKLNKESAHITPPAITIFALNPATQAGWRNGQKWTSNGILSKSCANRNPEQCVNEETYDRTEFMEDAFLGYAGSSRSSLMNNSLWTEDLSYMDLGRSFTANFNWAGSICNQSQDQLSLFLNKTLLYNIYIHDPDYFLVNYNPVGLPSLYLTINPTKSFNFYETMVMTEHHEMNLPSDPCVEDTSYNFQASIHPSTH
jgi:hypothetical protein